MPDKKESELIKTIADRAMEIHRKNKKLLPLAIHEAVNELKNITSERQIELRKAIHQELVRRSKVRRGNKYHKGVMSSIRRFEKKIKP